MCGSRKRTQGDPTSDEPDVHPGWRLLAEHASDQGQGPPPALIPPRLPLEFAVPPEAGEVIRRLEEIWLHASPDAIGSDLEEARRLASQVEPAEAELAQRFVAVLARLERWLRDV